MTYYEMEPRRIRGHFNHSNLIRVLLLRGRMSVMRYRVVLFILIMVEGSFICSCLVYIAFKNLYSQSVSLHTPIYLHVYIHTNNNNNNNSLWPTLGAFCRLTNYAFGLPTNVNIYVTPPGSKVSVPPHTDRQVCFFF